MPKIRSEVKGAIIKWKRTTEKSRQRNTNKGKKGRAGRKGMIKQQAATNITEEIGKGIKIVTENTRRETNINRKMKPYEHLKQQSLKERDKKERQNGDNKLRGKRNK